jgi:hypothetical protein
MNEKKASCFVIMPFSKSSESHTQNYWTDHYENFLKPIIESVPGFVAHRIEELRGDILRQIITDLVVSSVVVAELTDHNPNVFWELGVRQSFKHNTITIAEEGTILPFDVTSKATLFYNKKDDGKKQEFISQFKRALQDCINNPDKPDSHVLETLSGRGSLFEIMRVDEAKRRVEGILHELKGNYERCKKILFVDNYNPGIYPIFLDTDSLEYLCGARFLNEEQKFYNFMARLLRAFKNLNLSWLNANNLEETRKILEIYNRRKLKNLVLVNLETGIDMIEKINKRLTEQMALFSSKI